MLRNKGGLKVKLYLYYVTVKAESRAILYGWWVSSCSWRVRAVLRLKKIPFEERSVDIVQSLEHLTDQYRDINPSQKVPALTIDGVTLVESMAIIQYLEETRPDPPLHPKTLLLRARMREICETLVSGIQPLQNYGLKKHFDTEEQFVTFTRHWASRGLKSLEPLLEKSAGKYSVGDQLTLADICLVPQLFNSVTRHKLDLSIYPTISKLYETLMKEKVFEESHPKTAKPKKLS